MPREFRAHDDLFPQVLLRTKFSPPLRIRMYDTVEIIQIFPDIIQNFQEIIQNFPDIIQIFKK